MDGYIKAIGVECLYRRTERIVIYLVQFTFKYLYINFMGPSFGQYVTAQLKLIAWQFCLNLFFNFQQENSHAESICNLQED